MTKMRIKTYAEEVKQHGIFATYAMQRAEGINTPKESEYGISEGVYYTYAEDGNKGNRFTVRYKAAIVTGQIRTYLEARYGGQ